MTPETLHLIAAPLPRYRPIICDLNAGHGALAVAVATEDTRTALLIEPQNIRTIKHDHLRDFSTVRICSPIAGALPLLRDVGFQSELFVSQVATADEAKAHLSAALELCSVKGEGVLVGPVIPAAWFGEMKAHIWARIQTPTGTILYWAKDYRHAPRFDRTLIETVDFEKDFAAAINEIAANRRVFRDGKQVFYSSDIPAGAVERFRAVKEEWNILSGHAERKWNLSLKDGKIQAHITAFQGCAARWTPIEKELLLKLSDQSLMTCVGQRQTRELLLSALVNPLWRAQPGLQAKIEAAVCEYHKQRSPLYPLSKIMSLGYVEEADSLECCAAMPGLFSAGKKYAVTCQTLTIRRRVTKPGTDGTDRDLLLTGQELGIFLTAESGKKICFLDAHLHAEGIEIEGEVRTKVADNWTPEKEHEYISKCVVRPDFTLEKLVEHFVIPTAPDVAALQPALYQANLTMLDEIERRISIAQRQKD